MSHVMVCGFGQVGYRVATLLLELGEEVTVVTTTPREEWMRIAEARGAKFCIGDARDETFLEECGLKEAKAVIACTHNDGANIEISLDVRRHYPEKRTIARIIDPSLAKQTEKHLGVHRAVSMTSAAAPVFAAATYGDDVLTEFTIGGERFIVLKIDGPQHLRDEPLVVMSTGAEPAKGSKRDLKDGQTAVVVSKAETMSEQVPKGHHRHSLLKALAPTSVAKFAHGVWTNTSVQLRAVLIVIFSLIVVSIVVFQYGMNLSFVDALYFVVTTATTVGYGDISPKDASAWLKLYTCLMMVISATGLAVLFSMVTDYILTARLMQLVGRHHIPDHGHILVVGAGDIGHRTVEELVRLGANVVVIEPTEDAEYLSTVRTRVHVLIGDGREPDTLERAGIRHAKAIIATSMDDASNLSAGFAAKELNPDVRVVLSIFDVDFATKIQSIGEIDAALSPPLLAAPTFVGAALYPHAVASFLVGDRFFTLCEDKAGDLTLAGKHALLHTRELHKVPGQAKGE
ncbi:MAG: potassium channel family protein [Fimbriimonadales bacterium]